MTARCFVDMENALDVAFENFFERPFDGDAAQMHDGVAPLDHLVHGLAVGQIARMQFFAFGRFSQRLDVGHTQDARHRLEGFAQHASQSAGRPCQQESFTLVFTHTTSPSDQGHDIVIRHRMTEYPELP